MPEVWTGSEESNHAVLCDLRIFREEMPPQSLHECEGERTGAEIKMKKTSKAKKNRRLRKLILSSKGTISIDEARRRLNKKWPRA